MLVLPSVAQDQAQGASDACNRILAFRKGYFKVSAQWVTWNGGSGKYRDNQGRARTRIHITGENHETAICGVVVSADEDADEDAEVARREMPIPTKRMRRVCSACYDLAVKLKLI